MLQTLQVAINSILFVLCIVLVSIFLISEGYPLPLKSFF